MVYSFRVSQCVKKLTLVFAAEILPFDEGEDVGRPSFYPDGTAARMRLPKAKRALLRESGRKTPRRRQPRPQRRHRPSHRHNMAVLHAAESFVSFPCAQSGASGRLATRVLRVVKGARGEFFSWLVRLNLTRPVNSFAQYRSSVRFFFLCWKLTSNVLPTPPGSKSSPKQKKKTREVSQTPGFFSLVYGFSYRGSKPI